MSRSSASEAARPPDSFSRVCDGRPRTVGPGELVVADDDRVQAADARDEAVGNIDRTRRVEQLRFDPGEDGERRIAGLGRHGRHELGNPGRRLPHVVGQAYLTQPDRRCGREVLGE